ncbi:hypothetical protein P4O66_008694 [Electrophorus voltai]|uniref:Uncharacterized protein n=1 Tax=Electrophorus voltai TaxID=2609070 RepID=A0AAD8ZFW5_9TELE|nr:hypothetical protein P4O66_008694 [Electrophorus voltai]
MADFCGSSLNPSNHTFTVQALHSPIRLLTAKRLPTLPPIVPRVGEECRTAGSRSHAPAPRPSTPGTVQVCRVGRQRSSPG